MRFYSYVFFGVKVSRVKMINPSFFVGNETESAADGTIEGEPYISVLRLL